MYEPRWLRIRFVSQVKSSQAQLHYLQTYCDAKKLTVNIAKTQVMILRPGGRQQQAGEGGGLHLCCFAIEGGQQHQVPGPHLLSAE